MTAAIFDASNRWTNQTGVPVITNDNPIAGITVPVSATGAATSGDSGLGPLGWILAIIGIAALIAAVIVFIRSRRPPSTTTKAPPPTPAPPPAAGPGTTG